MRTTIELPDELLARAKSKAALSGLSLKEFFVVAIERQLVETRKTRRDPPVVDGPEIGLISPEQIDEAMFG